MAMMCVAMGVKAADSASFEFGTGNKSQLTRLGMQWNWERQWFKSNGMHLGAYWDATISVLHQGRYQNQEASKNIADVGITPVLRFQRDDRKGVYAEAGIGAHYMSSIYDNNHRTFSTNFQFGDHIGVGYVFDGGLNIGLKIQHFSNCGIQHPNPGANFVVLQTAHAF